MTIDPLLLLAAVVSLLLFYLVIRFGVKHGAASAMRDRDEERARVERARERAAAAEQPRHLDVDGA